MGGAKLESLYINDNDNNKNGIKNLEIKISRGNNETVQIYEQIEKIEIGNKKSLEVNFCMKDPWVGIQECANIFDIYDVGYAKELDNYTFTLGKPCKSLMFRPGSVLLSYSSWLDDYSFDGNLCKVEYSGYPINIFNYNDCCLGKEKLNCNDIISNGYTTNHCNSCMLNYCKDNPSEGKCIEWLENRTKDNDDIPLNLYSNLCKINHDKDYCTYMCLISRKYDNKFSKYCDNALIEWCKINNSDKCTCLNSNSKIIKEFEKYLGPKPCWLNQCVNSKQKWKTTDQINIQKNCNILSCIIDINKLNTIGNSKIELINNCISGTSSSSSNNSSTFLIDFAKLKKEQTYGFLFNPFLIFITFVFIIFFLICFYEYKDNEININNFINK